jgi:outer membrane protein
MLVTAERYFDVVLAQESVRVLRRQRLAVGQASAETQDRFRLGDVPITDTHEAAARLEAIDAQVLALETDLQLKQAILSDATGLQPAAMALLLPADEILPEARRLDEWLADAETGNFQLRMRRVAVEVERQESLKSSGAFSPNVDLVAQVGRERLGGRGEFGSASSGSGNGLVGVQIVVPLYTGGMRDARHQEAQHAIDKAQAQVERTRQTVAQQVRAAWLGLTVGSSRIRALSQALASNRSRLDATRLGRKVGDRTTLDLLNAENDAAGAELALLSARAQSLMNRLRLAAASGRLDEATLASANASLQAPASH